MSSDLSIQSGRGLLGLDRGNGAAGQTEAAPGFGDMIKAKIGEVNQYQSDADQAIQDLATGRKKTLHETMIQVEQADISFRMLMAVRTKVMNAYQEIMRMSF